MGRGSSQEKNNRQIYEKLKILAHYDFQILRIGLLPTMWAESVGTVNVIQANSLQFSHYPKHC